MKLSGDIASAASSLSDGLKVSLLIMAVITAILIFFSLTVGKDDKEAADQSIAEE